MDWTTSEAVDAFADALAAIEVVTKSLTADTGKYTYSYADLGAVLEECKRACALHGLVITQVPSVVDGHLSVATALIHMAGSVLAFDPLMMVLPKEAQAFGSALTYARRYALMTIFGIAPEDDDGRAATVAAQTSPGRRSEAERMIRESMGEMDSETSRAFQADFREHFGVTLTDLPVKRHGDALTWSRQWEAPVPAGADQAGTDAG